MNEEGWDPRGPMNFVPAPRAALRIHDKQCDQPFGSKVTSVGTRPAYFGPIDVPSTDVDYQSQETFCHILLSRFSRALQTQRLHLKTNFLTAYNSISDPRE